MYKSRLLCFVEYQTSAVYHATDATLQPFDALQKKLAKRKKKRVKPTKIVEKQAPESNEEWSSWSSWTPNNASSSSGSSSSGEAEDEEGEEEEADAAVPPRRAGGTGYTTTRGLKTEDELAVEDERRQLDKMVSLGHRKPPGPAPPGPLQRRGSTGSLHSVSARNRHAIAPQRTLENVDGGGQKKKKKKKHKPKSEKSKSETSSHDVERRGPLRRKSSVARMSEMIKKDKKRRRKTTIKGDAGVDVTKLSGRKKRGKKHGHSGRRGTVHGHGHHHKSSHHKRSKHRHKKKKKKPARRGSLAEVQEQHRRIMSTIAERRASVAPPTVMAARLNLVTAVRSVAWASRARRNVERRESTGTLPPPMQRHRSGTLLLVPMLGNDGE